MKRGREEQLLEEGERQRGRGETAGEVQFGEFETVIWQEIASHVLEVS